MTLSEIAPGNGPNGNEQPAVDVVAVHGLNPWNDPDHALNTWRKPSGPDGTLWLRDVVPPQIPLARIFIYKYDSNPTFTSDNQTLVHQANDLLNRIAIKRKQCLARPLIFISHSLGGILVKQALVNAHNNPEPKYNQIKLSTCGLVFFGTPHNGGTNFGDGLQGIGAHVVRQLYNDKPPRDIADALETGSPYSILLKESWRHQLNLYKIISFYELKSNIVSRESATIGLPGNVEEILGLQTDHSGLCKFDLSNEEDSAIYEVVSESLIEAYEAAISHTDEIVTNVSNGPAQASATTTRIGISGLGVLIGSSQQNALAIISNQYRDIDDDMKTRYVESFHHFPYQQGLKLQSSVLTHDSWSWFDKSIRYRKWAGARKSTKPQFLWIVGQSGIGKSPLLARITQTLDDTGSGSFERDSLVLYSMYDKRRNCRGSQMLCTLIHQIFSQLPELRENVYYNDVQKFGSISRPSNRPQLHLWSILHYLLVQSSRSKAKIFIILDGLYQCDNETQDTFLKQLNECRGGIRILLSWPSITSIPSQIQPAANGKPVEQGFVSLDDDKDAVDGINADLDRFVGTRLDSPTFSHLNDAAKKEIYQDLRERNGHTFLTTCLNLDRVLNSTKKDDAELNRPIRHLPRDTDEIYRLAVEDLRCLVSSGIMDVLKYLIFSFEPLKVDELLYALQREHNSAITDKDQLCKLIDHCAPLIIMVKNTQRMKFWHQSAQNFVVSYVTNLPPNDSMHLGAVACHQHLAASCLMQIMTASELQFPFGERLFYGNSLDKFFSKHTLLQYSFRNWYRHLRIVASSVHSPDQLAPHLIENISLFSGLWKDNTRARIRHLAIILGEIGVSKQLRTVMSRFELFCALGLTVFVQAILDDRARNTDPGKLQGRIEVALALSIQEGHTDTAKMLIKRYDITSLDGPAYQNLLQATVLNDRIELMQMLLKMRKRDPVEIADASRAAFMTANVKVVQALSADWAFQDRDQWGNTVLHAEVGRNVRGDTTNNESADTVARIKFLVEREKIDVHAKDLVMGNSALHLACWNGYGPLVVHELVKMGADPFTENTFKWTPLHLAARYGDDRTTRALISAGGKQLVGKVTRGGNSALHWATQTLRLSTTFDDLSSFDRREQSIRLLLEAGADPLLKNKAGETATAIALSSSIGTATLQMATTRLLRPLECSWRPPDSDNEVSTSDRIDDEISISNHVSESDSDILRAWTKRP